MYVCADHMAHFRMGLCDAHSSKKIGKRLCPYCTASPELIHNLQEDRQILEIIPRHGSLLPNIPMNRRVPDLLHMVKNVTKWMMKNTSRYFIGGSIPSTKILRNKQDKWVNERILPYLNKSRSKISSNGIPLSDHTAYWNFMKPGSGWLEII